MDNDAENTVPGRAVQEEEAVSRAIGIQTQLTFIQDLALRIKQLGNSFAPLFCNRHRGIRILIEDHSLESYRIPWIEGRAVCHDMGLSYSAVTVNNILIGRKIDLAAHQLMASGIFCKGLEIISGPVILINPGRDFFWK